MQIKYSPNADALMIRLKDGDIVDSIDLCEGIIPHYSKDNKIIKIEILDASHTVKMSELNVSLKNTNISAVA